MLNKEGIRQLKFDLRANAEHYNQSSFGSFEPCGTVMCLAGFCRLREVGKEQFERELRFCMIGENHHFGTHCQDSGKRQLGISSGFFLFGCGASWPNDLYLRLRHAEDRYAAVEVACEVLDRLREDGSIV